MSFFRFLSILYLFQIVKANLGEKYDYLSSIPYYAPGYFSDITNFKEKQTNGKVEGISNLNGQLKERLPKGNIGYDYYLPQEQLDPMSSGIYHIYQDPFSQGDLACLAGVGAKVVKSKKFLKAVKIGFLAIPILVLSSLILPIIFINIIGIPLILLMAFMYFPYSNTFAIPDIFQHKILGSTLGNEQLDSKIGKIGDVVEGFGLQDDFGAEERKPQGTPSEQINKEMPKKNQCFEKFNCYLTLNKEQKAWANEPRRDFGIRMQRIDCLQYNCDYPLLNFAFNKLI